MSAARPAVLRPEQTPFPAWPCALMLPDGRTFRRFKTWEALSSFLDRNGYTFVQNENGPPMTSRGAV